MKKVAIVAICRNESNYINEWISHHLGIGINHIYLYDNFCDGDKRRTSDYIDEKYKKYVTVIDASNKKYFQMGTYTESYKSYEKLYDYMVYIDIDEFIMLQKDTNIQSFINRFPKDLQCYRMNWLTYDDNDLITRDIKNEVTKDFTRHIEKYGETTKTIIKTGIKDIIFKSPHFASIVCNNIRREIVTYCGNFKKIDDKPTPFYESDDKYEYVKLNHYMTKSLQEFIDQKVCRGDASNKKNVNKYTVENYYFEINKRTKEKEEYLKKHEKI